MTTLVSSQRPSTYDAIISAIHGKDVAELTRILRANPDWPPNQRYLAYPHDLAASSGLAVFKSFVEHFPQTQDWDCNHAGNLVGISATLGDVALLRYCLEDLGHGADEGRWLSVPALDGVEHLEDTFIPGHKEEVVRLLKLHGATAKGTFKRAAKKEEKVGLFDRAMGLTKGEPSALLKKQGKRAVV
ncbi:hypothetical protein G6011_00072 [Alternaria panax]|uniref:Uncharacterized protein n=1 Tax=Alternaria panax TaxID=48097 RepID=A0AAD4IHJ4_9PLEO|nr:hypothetical protein G6011_00072 [Alternaria panax]